MAQKHAGQSLVGMLWDQLDAQYNKLKELHDVTGGYTVDNLTHDRAQAVDYLQTQGKVSALCFAVGTVLYPYDDPKQRIDKVRAELPGRWADAYGDPEEDNYARA